MTKNKIPFLGQSKPPETQISDMTSRGLIVPHESTRRLGGYVGKLYNPTGGDVVSYKPLAALLRDGKISVSDAKAMLWLEGNRKSGEPRDMHIDRLMIVAFSQIKKEILETIYG